MLGLSAWNIHYQKHDLSTSRRRKMEVQLKLHPFSLLVHLAPKLLLLVIQVTEALWKRVSVGQAMLFALCSENKLLPHGKDRTPLFLEAAVVLISWVLLLETR